MPVAVIFQRKQFRGDRDRNYRSACGADLTHSPDGSTAVTRRLSVTNKFTCQFRVAVARDPCKVHAAESGRLPLDTSVHV